MQTKLIFSILILLLVTACARTVPDYRTGSYTLHTVITITDDWCYMDGVEVQGVIRYYKEPQLRAISTICVSKRSDDIHETFKHELTHAYLNAIGEDAEAYFE
jgi:hypothetical protein